MAVEDPTKKQIEEVDPEIAEILGLEDTFDFDQEEYLTLLKEKMVEARMNDSKFSSEQAMKITDEYKRVKNLKESKFTAPKKTVNPDSFFGRKKEEKEQKPITDTAKLLPGSGGSLAKYQPPEEPEVEKEPEVDKNSEKIENIENFLNGSLLDIVKEIRSLTEDILKVFNNQAKVNKKGQEKSRIESNKQKKASRENKLEAQKESKGSKLLEKITKPFTSIFDTIKDFILNILLGSFVVWLLSVLKNPRKLLQPIQNLINGIVGFFNTVLNFIDNLVVKPIRDFISTMNSAISGFIDLLNNALKFLPGSPQIPDPKNGVLPNIPAMPQITPPDITGQNNQQQNQQQQPAKTPSVNVRFGGGPITKNKQVFVKNVGGSMSGGTKKSPEIGNDTASNFGGVVNRDTVNTRISGLGPDQYLTALSLGEYILKPGAVDFLGGEQYLDTVNRLFGGTNQRKIASMGDIKIEAMNTGGSVGRGDGESGRGRGGGRSSGSSPGGIKGPSTQPPTKLDPADSKKSTESPPSKDELDIKLPPSASRVQTKDGRQLIPDQYTKNTKHTTYIKVGEKNPKSYILKYERKGDTKEPIYVIKQINKLVQSSFLGLNDKLTGVNVKSAEGQSVLASTNARNWFNDYDNMGLLDPKKIKLVPDENSDLWFWYTRSYKANYDYWKKNGKITDNDARQRGYKSAEEYIKHLSARAAAEFAMPGKNKDGEGLTLMPGADNPAAAPEHLKTVAVDSDVNNSSGSDSSSSPNKTIIDPNFKIEGAKVKESYLNALRDGTYTGSGKQGSSGTSGTPGTPETPGTGGGSVSNFLKLSGTPATGGGTPATGGATPATGRAPLATGGTTILNPTKTAASMPWVFEAARKAREDARAEGLSPAEVERRVVEASERAVREGPSPTVTTVNQNIIKPVIPPTTINQNSIQPVRQPTIPGTPETKSSLTVLPMAGPGSGGQGAPKSGNTSTGTTPQVSFASFDQRHTTIVSVAAIYNIWGM